MRQALTIKEVAKRLAVHPRTVRRMIERGELPAARIGRLWRIAPEAVDRLLQQRQGTSTRANTSITEEELPEEDRLWLEDNAEEMARRLAEVEAEIPPDDLNEYLREIERRAVPVRWNPERGEFEKVGHEA